MLAKNDFRIQFSTFLVSFDHIHCTMMLIFHGDDMQLCLELSTFKILCLARVFAGAQVLQLRSLYMLRMSILIPMHVQNIIFIGEVFQIKVSDGLVNSLGSCQKVNVYPARVHEFVCKKNLKLSLQCVYKIAYLLLKYFKWRSQMVWSIPQSFKEATEPLEVVKQ